MDLFGRLQTDGGYTPAEIRAMTLADVRRLFAYWHRYPPLRDLVAGFVGFKPPPPAPTAPARAGDPPRESGEMLVALFPDGQLRV